MKHRVVVTGIGAITPLGNNVDTFWENIKKEKMELRKFLALM